jgi:hypothetical protein
MSNDGQLTITMNKLEQKISGLEKQLHKKNKELQDLTEKLSYSMICLWNGWCPDNHFGHFKPWLFVHMNIKTLNVDVCQMVNLELIQYLYQLNDLTLRLFYNHGTNIKTSKLSNKTVTKLYINDCNNHINSLDGLNQLPLLNNLRVYNGNVLTNVPTVLSSYDHKLKQLSFQGCPQINVVEMQTYCQKNNIQLDIK